MPKRGLNAAIQHQENSRQSLLDYSIQQQTLLQQDRATRDMKWADLIQEGNRIDELVVAAEHALGSFSSMVAQHKSKLNEQATLLNNTITTSNTLRKHFKKDADEVVESQKRLVDDEDKLADLREALGELEAEMQPLRNEYENLSMKLSESMTLAESTRFEGEPAQSPPPSQLQLGTHFTEMQQPIQHESSSTRKSPSPRKRDLHGSSTDANPEKPSHAKRHRPESLSQSMNDILPQPRSCFLHSLERQVTPV